MGGDRARGEGVRGGDIMYYMKSMFKSIFKYNSTLFYKYDITSTVYIHYINACYLFPVPVSIKVHSLLGTLRLLHMAVLVVTSVLLRHRM